MQVRDHDPGGGKANAVVLCVCSTSAAWHAGQRHDEAAGVGESYGVVDMRCACARLRSPRQRARTVGGQERLRLGLHAAR